MKEQGKAKTPDMGSGSIPKLLASLAIPAIVAQVINLLYNIVDRIYIGHIPEVGASALTGVGLCLPILMLLTAFSMMVGTGGAPLTAIAMGKGDHERGEKIIGNSFSLLVILAIILTIVFYTSAPALLRLFGASDVTLPYAVDYARIYCLGAIFVLMVMGMNPFITTQGFAKISMMTTIIGAIVNIILDPIFIFALGMGVKGAALATVLSQAIGAIWILRFLTSEKPTLRLRRENLKLDPRIFGPCLGLGIASFVMVATESLLSISFNSSLSRYGGDLAVGAMTILTSVTQLVTMPMQGLCQGGQPIISYNYGAGNKDRVKKTFYLVLTICVCYATFFWAICMFMPQVFAQVFTNNPALVEYTSWAMRIYLACIFSMGFQNSCQQSFMALGQAKISLLLACLRKIILLIPLIFLLPMFFEDKVFAVFLAEPVSDFLAAAITTIAFFSQFNKILNKSSKASASNA